MKPDEPIGNADDRSPTPIKRVRVATPLVVVIAVVTVAVILLAALVARPPAAQERLRVLRAGPECGSFELHYPTAWITVGAPSTTTSCYAWLQYPSLNKSSIPPEESVAVQIHFVERQAASRYETYYQSIVDRAAKKPLATSSQFMQCARNASPPFSNAPYDIIDIECAGRGAAGIYLLAATVDDPSARGYEAETTQIISSFTLIHP